MSQTLAMIQAAPAIPNPFGGFNPFAPLGSAAGKVVADGWTAIMLAIWNAGMWLLRLALKYIDAFMTPDLRENGPGKPVYQMSLWIGMCLFTIMSSVQLAVSAVQRSGRGLARVLIGYAQFVVVWAAFITYAVAVIAAAAGLTDAILSQLLHIPNWAKFEPLGARIEAKDVTEGSVATVLGVMGIVLIFAAIAHILVMIARAAALMVIVSTASISAGGLGSDAGKQWFWKTFRWFHAAALSPPLMALVLGLGASFTAGVATGLNDGIQKAVGTAVPGTILTLVAAFVPLALFKLLAFTDPNTNSGAAMRAGLNASGGMQGLFGGGKSSETSGSASSVDSQGKSQAESSSEAESTGRVANAMKALGPIGQAVGTGIGFASGVATKSASLGADLTNQMGVGHGQYVPDFGGGGGSGSGNPARRGGGGDGDGDDGENSPSPESGTEETAPTGVEGSPAPDSPDVGAPVPGADGGVPTPPVPGADGGVPTPPSPADGQGETSPIPSTSTGGGTGAGEGAGAAGAGGSGEAAGAAATVPPVV